MIWHGIAGISLSLSANESHGGKRIYISTTEIILAFTCRSLRNDFFHDDCSSVINPLPNSLSTASSIRRSRSFDYVFIPENVSNSFWNSFYMNGFQEDWRKRKRQDLFLIDPVFSGVLIVIGSLQTCHKRHIFVFVTQWIEEWAICYLWRIEQRYRQIGNVIRRVSLSSVLKWFNNRRLLGPCYTVLSTPWLTLSQRLNPNS